MKSATIARVPEQKYDPKRELLAKLGDLSGVEIAQNEVLIAIYRRAAQTAGGIYIPQKTLDEDKYQGKVGLVLNIGGACQFLRTDPETGRKYGIEIKLHDWVVVRPSDTWALDINSDTEALQVQDFVQCRLVYDDQIRMRIPDPRIIW